MMNAEHSANAWEISVRRVRMLCAEGRVDGAKTRNGVIDLLQPRRHRISGKLSVYVSVMLWLLMVLVPVFVCAESPSIRITGFDLGDNRLFVRAQFAGSSGFGERTVDAFISTNLACGWSWIDSRRIGAGLDESAVLIVPQLLSQTNLPPQLFVRMSDRQSANGDLGDRDSDSSPNVYELHHGTNPYIADFEDSPRTVVASDCDYATLTNVLWTSSPYAIIELSGEMYFDRSIDLPGWPLLLTGPTNGYAVIHSTADVGVFMVNRRQTEHTLLRNIYLTMDKESSFQAGFWIGGNLPWTEDAAGASFENIRLRMCNPGVWYYGWHMYGETDTPVVISNCTISAKGATDVMPVYVYGDSQVVFTNALALVNMPGAQDSGNHSWSGYPLSDDYGADRDSDGDGVSDYEEVMVYGTDLYLRDSDGDRVNDGVELAHGANPTNRGNYCCSLTASITNEFFATGSVKAALYNISTGDRISAIHTATGRTDTAILHGIVEDGGVPAMHIWTVDENSFENIPLRFLGHDHSAVAGAAETSRLFDRDQDGMSDLWESANGFSPQSAADALADNDGDGLVNLHEYWAGTDPYAVDGSNTLLSVCARSVDGLLHGRNPADSWHKFVNYTGNDTNFVLNAGFWAHNVDTSCASIWNDARHCIWGEVCEPWHMAGTAISRRHIVTAHHYAIPVGAAVWFMGNDGVAYFRKITGLRPVGGDICVESLDRELPEAVVPAKIFPAHYAQYIKNGHRLPVVTFDQEEKLIVADSAEMKEYAQRGEASGAKLPVDGARLQFYEPIVSGDSGNPRFMIVDNELVLLCVMHYGGKGSGTMVTHFRAEIESAMDDLCPGYDMEEINVDDYERLP